MKIDLDNKTDVLTYHKKLLAEVVKEKEELKTKLENFQSSSKGLSKLLNSQMSTRDKSGLGYGDQVHNGVLSYENEVFQSVFDSRSSDVKDSHVHDRFANVEGMHAVPPPMIGNYMPSGPDREVDDSMFTYGPKQSKTSESDTQTSNYDSCESNSSAETLESVPEPVVVEPKVVSQPKVLNDEPIIEEWHSDCDDEEIVVEPKEIKRTVKPGFKKVEPINAMKETVRPWNNYMTNKHGLGFTKKVCFVCTSPNHLIKDCNFHENRMARKPVLNNEGKGSGQRVVRPVWNNTQRVNHKNFANKMTHPHPKRDFVPTAVLTRSGQVNTVRQNFPKALETVNTARLVSTAFKRPNVNVIRPKAFYKSHSSVKRPFYQRKAPKTKFSNQKVNTVRVNRVNTARPKAEVNTVKASASLVWKPKQEVLDHVSKSDSASKDLTRYGYIDPLGGFKSIMAWVFKRH
ncbi:hypothetical protein Tco_0040543 [Tanacetum coccineum]